MDIEDLAFNASVDPRSVPRHLGVSAVTKRIKQEDCQLDASADVPGTQCVWLKTFGCSHNTSDSEFMAGLLKEYGYDVVIDDASAERCDAWVVNSCTVKGPSQAAVDNLVARAKSKKIPIVVAGCVPQGERSAKSLKEVSLLGVAQIDRIVEAVEETLRGNTVRLLARNKLPRLDLVSARTENAICFGRC